MATLSSLRHLILLDCISCPHLPPLGQLPHLRYLDIDGALAVVTIGLEFLGNGVTAFPKLEFLYFNNMPNLEEWSMGEEIEDEGGAASTVRDITLPFYVSLLPCLTTMHLIDCPKLLALPEQLKHATMLQTLYIEGAHSLRAVENLPSLTQWLQISKSDSILRVSNLPQLRMLVLIHLPALSCVQNLDALQFLYVEDLLMDCLPDWVSGLLHQRQHHLHDNDLEFQMMCNIHVLERCQLGHQDWPIIQQFPKVRAHTIFGFVYLEYTKLPFTYNTNLPELSGRDRRQFKSKEGRSKDFYFFFSLLPLDLPSKPFKSKDTGVVHLGNNDCLLLREQEDPWRCSCLP
ncbi:uncharacterized protein [Typha angustifolia]|uniref:uncharacterized protein isoform X2 n=1 Tax=Typha angustifolia TaxID=59011 RepID=UPI003C2AEE56